ncbi:MAG: nickel pincer cofactor biosynthesis protein LarC [Desulfomonile tiedjei]|nr:nickel pincer cofactor biosynthesis protein LarC [Desulfomonile tiedjei]
MKIAYFDCFSGASGDMIMASLIDAGLGPDDLKDELAKLHLTDYDLQVRKATRKGISGSQVTVLVGGHHHHEKRSLSNIREIIERSDLDESVKIKAVRIFTRLAEAEARVHDIGVEEVHFHEVGAMDAIIDVVGSVAGLAVLGIEEIYCSALNLGGGHVKCAHGVLPVPAPATAELVKGKPVYSFGVEGELLTPTGAAILTTLSSNFGPMPAMTADGIGYGAGTSDFSVPNLLRVVIGKTADKAGDYLLEQIAVLETNIDDMNPQIYEYLIQSMLEKGALDVFLVPVQMKKSRPGTLLTVTCSPDRVDEFSDFLMRETTSLGVRWRIDHRIKAERHIEGLDTKYGPISFKVATVAGKIVNVTAEYEDCKRLALEKGVPLKEVMEEARTLAIRFMGK